MNTIYQLRDNDTDKDIGLYTFEDNSLNIEELYKLYQKSNEWEFDVYLEKCSIHFTRLFVEEIYV